MFHLSPPLRWLYAAATGHVLAADEGEAAAAAGRLRYTAACGYQTSTGRVVEARPVSICGRCRGELIRAGIDPEAKGERP